MFPNAGDYHKMLIMEKAIYDELVEMYGGSTGNSIVIAQRIRVEALTRVWHKAEGRYYLTRPAPELPEVPAPGPRRRKLQL
jgi:hypothetical protein